MLELPVSAPRDIADGLAYWTRIRAQRDMPSRSDLDPMAIHHLLPYVMLVDVLRDPLDFRFRLVGTAIDEIVARSYTGVRFSELSHMAHGNQIWSEYERVVADQSPLYSKVRYVGRERDVRAIEHCLMPLSADAHYVDMMFVVVAVERA